MRDEDERLSEMKMRGARKGCHGVEMGYIRIYFLVNDIHEYMDELGRLDIGVSVCIRTWFSLVASDCCFMLV